MKLTCVEFRDFACFERRLVPIQPGVSVLVGKNNAGKSALLRGLTALNRNAVPAHPVAQEFAALAEYGQLRAGERAFDMDIRFQAETGDLPLLRFADRGLLQVPDSEWPHFVQKHKPEVVYSTTVWPRSGLVGICGCTFNFNANVLPLLERVGREYFMNSFILAGPSGGPRRVEHIVVRTGMIASPDGSNYPMSLPTDLFKPLQSLAPVNMIEAHRVTAPREPLRSSPSLAVNASNLASFLQTLQGRDRDRFQQIEEFFTRVFPEFSRINPESDNNQVFLSLTRRVSGQNVPLTHCGTGSEQVLTLASFVLTCPRGSTLLIDEPHSYLHPTAEREVIEFLLEHGEHAYLIATHSPVFINSVEAERLIYVAPGEPGTCQPTGVAQGPILRSLGYRNTDFAFNDRLIFVEGPSDREIIPILLKGTCKVTRAQIEGTGFPAMLGVPGGRGTIAKGPKRARQLQTCIMNCERFLAQIGRATLSRMYLFDGDFTEEEKTLLKKTQREGYGSSVTVKFLPRHEIENYLLVPSAIAAVIREQLSESVANDDGAAVESPSDKDVQEKLADLLSCSDPALYPHGKDGEDAVARVKGSVVLQRIFRKYDLEYDKRETGLRIAQRVPSETVPDELWELVRDTFA